MNIRILALSLTVMVCAASAQAQSLSATAIEIDITEGGPGTEPLLITTYQPQPDVAPRLSVFGTDVTQVALGAQAGLPRPSIILGRVEVGQEAAFGIESLLPATVEQIGFDHTNLEARIALRESNPALFQQLVEQGHVDPPQGQLNEVLQTELARMNCYRSGIDGAWGPGSRRSVGAYFDEISGVDWSDPEPSMNLFRTIILREDVACPTPVVAAPRATTRTTTNTTRRTTTKPAAVAKPKPAAKRKISTGAGIGVFR
tara:strand:- start:599 stop:1372 length:774 start_codon:yes stop_codon:yes gene_type:complete